MVEFGKIYESETCKGIKKFYFEEIDGKKYIHLLDNDDTFEYPFVNTDDEDMKWVIVESAKDVVKLYYL